MLSLRTPLIGERDVSPQIVVAREKNANPKARQGRAEFYYTHRYMPPPVSKDPKRPISSVAIEDIKRCIYRLSESPKLYGRYQGNSTLKAALIEYITARRNFMIYMFERTGMRPSELVDLNVSDHENILVTRSLKISTKKRRKHKAPMRSFPIKLNVASVVHRYMLVRKKFCEKLEAAGFYPQDGGKLFLTEKGKPMSKGTLRKDFEKIAKEAGYRSVKTCLSMFRHRFITLEITAHLVEFIEKSGKSRQTTTSTDYESILKRVTAKTGHGNTDSLWHYFDFAWDEMGVWGAVDQAIERMHAASQLFTDLLELKYEVELLDSRKANKRISLKYIAERLGEILVGSREDVEVLHLHGKQVLAEA